MRQRRDHICGHRTAPTWRSAGEGFAAASVTAIAKELPQLQLHHIRDHQSLWYGILYHSL